MEKTVWGKNLLKGVGKIVEKRDDKAYLTAYTMRRYSMWISRFQK